MSTVATTRGRRWLVGALAAAVLIAAIVLVVATRGGAATTDVRDRGTTASGGASDDGEHFPTPSGGTSARPGGAAPEIAVGPGATAPENTPMDPGAVRDHRGGEPGETVERKTTIPSTGPIEFDQKLSIAAAADAKPLALDCAKQIPADARGAKPVIQVRLQVSLKNGLMTVDDALTDLRDVAGDDLAKSVSACVKQGAAGKTYEARDHADIEHYQITIPLRVP